MDAANIHADHLGHHGEAAALLNYALGWVHDADIAVIARKSQAKSCEHSNGFGLRFSHNPGMDNEWISQALRRTGKTQKGLADALGLDPSAISRLIKGDRQLKASEVGPAADYLDAEPPIADGPRVRDRLERVSRVTPAFVSNREEVPILGMGEGSEDGWQPFNGEEIGRIPRPPSLNRVPNAYAVYVTGNSMDPRYREGEIIHVNPWKPPTNGCFVVVQAVNDRAMIKRLVRRSATKIVLAQYEPEKEFEIPLKDVVAMHRIVGSGE